MEGFWKSIALYVPREASDMRILNPYFIQEAAFQFIGLPLNNGLMGKGVSLMAGQLTPFASSVCPAGRQPKKGGCGSDKCFLEAE